MCRYATPYKRHYVCLACRSSYKQHHEPVRAHPCLRCGAEMINAGFDVAVPPRSDDFGWKTLTATLRAGITYHSCGCGGPGYRPRTAAEVRDRRIAAERLGIPGAVALRRVDPWARLNGGRGVCAGTG